MSFPNIYTHRKVAETSSRPCDICYKPSTSVLVTPENKDFFYVCIAHLKDRGFATPIIDEAARVAKQKKQMEAEIEKVKLEFEEKQRKKKEKEKSKDEKKSDKKDEKEDEKKIEEQKKSDETIPSPQEDEPRVFALKKAFYQQRLDKKRNAEIAKRNRERFQNPTLFPAVPKDLP